MTIRSNPQRPDPRLDLHFERVVGVSRELVWRAWTEPKHLVKWFTPAPWTTVDAEIDLRPGGIFRTVMRSPEGQEFPGVGCYLEVIAPEKLVWTNALAPGFRPAAPSMPGKAGDAFPFTAVLTFEPHGNGTRYSALVIHASEEDRGKHEAMGFHEGWGKALDQLVALARTL